MTDDAPVYQADSPCAVCGAFSYYRVVYRPDGKEEYPICDRCGAVRDEVAPEG